MRSRIAAALAGIAVLVTAGSTLAAPPLYSDDFNRADGALGAAWELSPFGPLPTISSNQACTPATTEAVAFYGSTFDSSSSAAVFVDVTASTLDSLKFGIILAQIEPAGPVYFQAQLRNDGGGHFVQIEIGNNSGPSIVQCTSATTTLAAGTTYKMYLQFLPGGDVMAQLRDATSMTLVSTSCNVGAQTPDRIVVLSGRDTGTGTACFDNFAFSGLPGASCSDSIQNGSETGVDCGGSCTACPGDPVDCVVGPWSSWGTCSMSCGGGTQTRTRSVTTPPANGGAACPQLSETQSCNTQPCPVDCVVGPWSEWGSCSATCGGGSQTRTRLVLTHAAFGGAPCPMLSETQSCNEQACDDPGFVPSTKDTLKCEQKVAKSVGKLVACTSKCQSAAAADAELDATACAAGCRSKYDAGAQKAVDKGGCPACLDSTTEQAAPADSAVADAESRAGAVYCDAAASDATLKCEQAIGKGLAKFGQCLDKCHAKIAAALLAGKAFDESACRAGCRSKYDSGAAKVTLAGACPSCLGATQQSDLADAVEAAHEAGNGDYYCEGTVPIP